MMDKLYELPEGWAWEKLTDIIRIGCERGFKPTIVENKVPFIGMSNIDQYSGRNTKYILEENDKVSKGKTKFQKNAVLLGKITPCTQNNKTTIVPDDIDGGYATTEVYALHCLEKIIPLYFNYYLRSKYINEFLVSSMIGATGRQRVPSESVKNINIPLPPLPKQQRIVSKLDTLFEKIDSAIDLHQKNMDETDLFMGSVLNEVFGELEEKYEVDNIGNMIDILTDYHSNGAYKTLKANVELLDHKDYALMIRATDLENKNYTKNVKYITEHAYNFMSKSKVYGGEIILPKIGTIGSVYFMPYLDRPVSLAMNLFMLRCCKTVDNKYLFLYLKSPNGYSDILSRANGAVTKTITKDAVRSIKLPLPPLPIQQKTVTYLDSISQKTQKLKQIQKEKMQSLIALKASILDQAFRGAL